eukprot:CAMPEP_0176327724 /NCGR_PEP_ID=MMETSP0121_2-20121125/74596_1 /TAXON_ID=160619 /ORGANISM="Kryptoperidinium foliaceum, Strain CCMP 1326" /LENGTH=40 /DNA_ID= /DNA_START= /DNA_END= /DNA_ORIENTATION=
MTRPGVRCSPVAPKHDGIARSNDLGDRAAARRRGLFRRSG